MIRSKAKQRTKDKVLEEKKLKCKRGANAKMRAAWNNTRLLIKLTS